MRKLVYHYSMKVCALFRIRYVTTTSGFGSITLKSVTQSLGETACQKWERIALRILQRDKRWILIVRLELIWYMYLWRLNARSVYAIIGWDPVGRK